MSAFDDPNYFTNTMFSYPSYDPNHLAPGPSSDYLSQQRHSISSTSDIFPLLSPSASSSNGSAFQAPPSLQHTSGSNSQSPRSSASPRSNGFYDTSVSDVDLDELLNLSAGDANGMNVFGGEYDQKPQMMNNNGDMQMQMQPQNLFLPNSGFGTMGGNGGGFDFGKLQADQLASMLFQQQQHQQQLQTMAPSWMQSQQEVLKQQSQFSQAPQNLFDFQNAKPLPTSESTPPVTKAKAAPKPAARRGPKPKENDENAAPLGPSGGKHNKTERRYRQKVQAAQTELRDSVPALRVLYGTSTEEQKQTTDIKLADGSVDGLGEITRPNASAKTTIFVGAKLYIELLQDRVAGLQRRVEELENYRSAVGGQADLDSWKSDFEQREKQRRELKELADQIKRSEESEEDLEEDEEEEEEPVVKRKKARKTVVKKEEGSSTVVRTFAAFAMTFSFLPSADKTFTTIPVHALPLSNPTTGQVISRLPIITAEHTARLLSRGLPSGSVPHPTTLVEWGWRILVAVVVAAVLGPIFRRISKMTRPGLVTTVKETAKYIARVEGKPNPTTVAYAAGIAGGIVRPSRMSYWYTIMHLNRTSSESYQLALLALLQPRNRFLPSSESLWKLARATINETTPASLVAVLDTPLVEAAHYLSNTTTSDPIASISEQLTLVHLNDLYTRMFTKLVMASTSSDGPLPTSTRALLANLDQSTVGKDLRSSSFDREIRDVIQSTSKGTASHALGLVLIGLWGIFTGPAPSSQAALVSALAAEEMLGQASIASVSAMLNLLYPGSSQPQPQAQSSINGNGNGNGNAQAIDRLALVCIEYLKLLLSSTSAKTRTERLEASKQIQRVSTNLRLALTLTEFVGLRGVEKDEDGFVLAKERLVGVLSNLGRKARGRVVSGDIDSGLEPEIDEL